MLLSHHLEKLSMHADHLEWPCPSPLRPSKVHAWACMTPSVMLNIVHGHSDLLSVSSTNGFLCNCVAA